MRWAVARSWSFQTCGRRTPTSWRVDGNNVMSLIIIAATAERPKKSPPREPGWPAREPYQRPPLPTRSCGLTANSTVRKAHERPADLNRPRMHNDRVRLRESESGELPLRLQSALRTPHHSAVHHAHSCPTAQNRRPCPSRRCRGRDLPRGRRSERDEHRVRHTPTVGRSVFEREVDHIPVSERASRFEPCVAAGGVGVATLSGRVLMDAAQRGTSKMGTKADGWR